VNFIRYGIPALLFVLGIVLFAIEPDSTGLHGLAMAWGAAASVLFLNVLFRLGAKGDLERQSEEDAREYFALHGRWPDEKP
jgi:hypothetical protein